MIYVNLSLSSKYSWWIKIYQNNEKIKNGLINSKKNYIIINRQNELKLIIV